MLDLLTTVLKRFFSKFCASSMRGKMLACAAMLLCVTVGAWGADGYYRWVGRTDSSWTTTSNWDGSTTAIGWDSPTNDTSLSAAATYYINTDQTGSDIVIVISEDVTVQNLYIESDSSKSVKIILENNATLKVTGTLTFGNRNSNNDTVNLTISGSGTISAGTLLYNNKATDSVITIESGTTLESYSFNNNSSGSLNITGSGVLYLNGNTLDNVNGITLDPTVVTDPANVPVDTDIYYWKGAASGGSWTDSTNWAPNSDLTGTVTAGTYPGHADGEKAYIVAPANEIAIENFTVADTEYSLTITNEGTNQSKRLILNSTPADYKEAKNITINGYVLFYGVETANSITVNTAGYLQASNITLSGDLTVLPTATVWTSGSPIEIQGKITNNGLLNCGSATVTFKGDYSGSGSLTASSVGTYFLGNADFSSCTGFNANGGTLYFYNTDASSSSPNELKTNAYSFTINYFYFGGNVTINLLGPLTATTVYHQAISDDYKLDSGTVSTITGSGSLTVGGILGMFRLNKDDDSVMIDELVIDAALTISSIETHSGTTVTVNAGKTLSVGTYNAYGNSGAPDLNLTILGTLSVGSELHTEGPSCTSNLTVGSGGTLATKSGATGIWTQKISNSGTVNLVNNTDILKFTAYAGADDGSDALNCAGGVITATDVANNGTISNLNLTGACTVGYYDSTTDEFSLGNVFIDSGATLIAAANYTVSGDWTNANDASGFNADPLLSVTFTGSGKTLAGDTTFSKAVFKEGVSLEGSNSFTDFTCEDGGITLTFGDGSVQTVTGNLTLKGSDGNLLELSSNSESTIVVPAANLTADYLSIGPDLLIREGASVVKGSHKAYGSENTSQPASGLTNADYFTLFKHGWDLDQDFVFTWTGASTVDHHAWSTNENWDLGIAPGMSANDTVGAKVLIPDGCEKYPVVYSNFSISSLTIGTETLSSHDAILTINNTGGLILQNTDSTAGRLINYGTIEYGSSGRINDGTNPLNDVANGGTVSYSGTGQTVTCFSSSGASYANLLVSGTATISDDVEVAGLVTVDAGASLTVGAGKTLTLDGNLLVNGSLVSDYASEVIFAGDGSSVQTITATTTDSATLQFAEVTVSSSAKVTTASSFEVTGSLKNENTSGDGFSASLGTITFSGISVTLSGKSKFNNIAYIPSSGSNGTFTLEKENSFTDSGIVAIGSASATYQPETVTLSASDGSLKLGYVNCTTLVIKSSAKFTESNTMNSLSCSEPGAILTFADGTVQSVTSLSILGSEGNEILLTGETEWNISPADFTKLSFVHAKITNSKNTESEPIIVYAHGGYNIDGGGNTNWIFAGQEYTWRSDASSTDWGNASNWSPSAVPGKYSEVVIPSNAEKYPLLTEDLDLYKGEYDFTFDADGDGQTESVLSSITIEDGAVLDFSGYKVTVSKFHIDQTSRLRLVGTEDVSDLGDSALSDSQPDYRQKGIIEYYGDFSSSASLVLGNEYYQLEFASGARGSVSDAVKVNGSTLIDSGSDVIFNNSLASAGVITIAGNVTSGGSAVFSSDEYILISGSDDRTFGTNSAAATLKFASDAFVDMENCRLTVSADVSFENLCLYSGEFASSYEISAGNLLAFGSAASYDDARYSGTDTRFAYYGYDDLAYKRVSGTFAASLGSGARFSISGNLYVNGLDLDGCTFVLPAQDSSHPVFNSGSSVTQNQWGLPYALVFNSTVSNCSATASSGSAFIAAASFQNVIDSSGGTGNPGFQFEIPKISEAYSVSDSVICVKFDMALENSNSEVTDSIALVSSLEAGGIFYNGAALHFDGKFYTESDGRDCSLPLSESSLASSDIPALTPLYLKVSSSENKWNTDATASSAGNSDSTDRLGIHRSVKTDLSFMEGLFYAADGKTMCRNYGSGLWSDDGSSYASADSYQTIDKARPVLVSVSTGQELHEKNSGDSDSQKMYDSHNFIEFRYSEPVDIGDLYASDAETTVNRQADSDFSSSSSHGGAISNSGTSLLISGFASIENGELTSGIKSGAAPSYTGTIDSAKPHALYRCFALSASESASAYPCRLRISVAGFVDEANPISFNGNTFHNWLGYIDSSTVPSGLVTPFANAFITDLAEDAGGNAIKNLFDENNPSRVIQVNDSVVSSSDSLYGDWDTLPPVFAIYVTNFDDSAPDSSWNTGDSTDRQYEMLGTVDSNTSAYIDKIEMHLFDNKPAYTDSDTYKWASRKGWVNSSGSTLVSPDFAAPETAGGSRAIPKNASMTYGGIRRSSLDGAYSAFSYTYQLDSYEAPERSFASTEISQRVKSSLFRNDELSETLTGDDGPYFGLTLNPGDTSLPIRTVFTIFYNPDNSFITDLAGNRLLQTDSGSDKKVLHTVDITPPSFTMTISPVGENKLYAVFTKPLAYNGTPLSSMGAELSSTLEKIMSNLEFVYSESNDVDTVSVPSGDKAISVLSAELASKSDSYTAILFTLNRNISLDDVEKIWLRVNTEGELTDTIFGSITASYIRDRYGNAIPAHTCHALSDFAVNAVNVLYGYADSMNGDGWDEHEIYGIGTAPQAEDYALHEFSEDGGNYNKIRSGHDIVFQFAFIGGKSEDGTEFAVQNGEQISLVFDSKANIRSEWKSDKYNMLTGSDWRVWLTRPLDSLSSSFNVSPISDSFSADGVEVENVSGSDILKNMTLKNDIFNFAGGNEYQFFFKILDADGGEIKINHDGDKTTSELPLYAFRMPSERIASGDFSFIDLWSFLVSDITKQRGGVTILNNVINSMQGEKTSIEVELPAEGNVNVFVMTLDGNIIKRLSKGTLSAGTHYFYWDGKNNAGTPVARGLYFVRVAGSGIDETRKVMVVK